MHNVKLNEVYRKRVDAEAARAKACIDLRRAQIEAVEILADMGAFHAFTVKWNVVSQLIHDGEL